MKRKETVDEMMAYRTQMQVIECVMWANNCVFPICPKCRSTMEREYQAYCDRCGQKLSWKKYCKAKIKMWNDEL